MAGPGKRIIAWLALTVLIFAGMLAFLRSRSWLATNSVPEMTKQYILVKLHEQLNLPAIKPAESNTQRTGMGLNTTDGRRQRQHIKESDSTVKVSAATRSVQLKAETSIPRKQDTISQIGLSKVCTSPADGAIRHFISTKIEKTGSTTLFSILGRFIWRNHLNIASQTREFHIHWTKQTLGKGWVIGPKKDEKAEAMICHAIYNQTAYNKYFVNDYRYIVTVRHPTTWIHSAVQFFSKNHPHIIKEKSTEKTILDNKLMFRGRDDLTGVRSYFHLPQLQWLGYDYMKYKNNLTAIREYIAWIVPKIDIIILNDQFDASVIVLRRKFCWSYTDVLFASKNVQRKKAKRELSDAAVKRLLSAEVNLGELLLYEALNTTWWGQEEVNQSDFWDEVAYYKSLNHNITETCQQWEELDKMPAPIRASKWHEQFVLTKPLCTYINLGTMQMLGSVINYAKGTFHPVSF